MVECHWYSVVLSSYSPVFTGLELRFMGVTRSNSSLFSTPGFVVSPVGKRERRKKKKKKKRREGGKKEIEKERKEGRGNKEISEARQEGIVTKIKT